MSDDPHPQKLYDLKTRQATLVKLLAGLQSQRDLETRVEEQMRSEKLIAETQEALYRVETELLTLQQSSLIAGATKLRRNGAYTQALECWQQIQFTYPDNSLAVQEIAALETLLANQVRAVNAVKRLSFRMKDIKPIFKEIAETLKQPDGSPEYSAILEQTEAFLKGELDARDFLDWYAVMKPNTSGHGVNIEALARRVQKGEVVLFLGSDLVSTYCDEPHEERELIEQLAKQIGYTHFDGTLSSIAECYQLRPDLGLTSLLDNLRQFLPDADRIINLYHVLAKINPPLILISSGYDNLLASTFQAAGKKFVELASIINRSEDYDIGHVVVSYSDHSQQPHVYPEEELSRLRLLESGYSIIYKIRGTCSAKNNGQDDLQRDAITLLERDYFKFARYSDQIIPDYLARKFRDRGFLFIGYRPKEWEDRLLVSALLEKRRYAKEEPYYVIGNVLQTGEHSTLLESAFWNRSKVNQHPFDFRELNAYLEKAGV